MAEFDTLPESTRPVPQVPPVTSGIGTRPIPQVPTLASGPNPMLPQPRAGRSAEDIIRAIVPLIAVASATRQNALGSLVQGYLSTEEQQAQQEHLQRADQVDQELADYRRRVLEQGAASDAASAAAEREKQKQSGISAAIANAMRAYQENPLYADGVTPEYANSAITNIPGLGPISLREVFDRYGVVKDPQGRYQVVTKREKKTTPKSTRQRADLADGLYDITYDENGKETGRTRLGTPYRAPRATPEPKAPQKPTVVVNVDDALGTIVKYSDPEAGTTESFTEDDVKDMLSKTDRPNDPATVRAVMRDPVAMKQLLAGE